jgi:NADPH-dependent 2,4-dienoyl-CoA reductase/sulfur reductase-like enzyme
MNMKFNRRRFLQAFGAAAAVAVTPSIVRANSAPHVVVVGGGFAGATVAKYLRMWSDKSIDVTLVDPNASHTSCVMSNLVLNGRIRLSELELSYDSLRDFYGVNVIRDRAIEILAGGKGVRLENSADLLCNRLVIATGIDFDVPEGTDFSLTPHAWIAGPQTTLLANKVNALSAGGSFVMTIPKSPYRCPPGPYERACLVADILKRKGGGTVTVLDANADIQAEKHTFSKAFDELYGDIVEYIPNTTLGEVRSSDRLVDTSKGEFKGDVVNIIPQQRALGFVRKAGLTAGGDWAAIDPLSYESTVPGFEGVHIIGDSQGSGQPKSAHMASSQAKVCADAIIRMITGNGVSVTDPERVANITTNSACYSPITYDEASWLTANFSYQAPDMPDHEVGKMVLQHIGEAEHWSRDNYEEMFAWASNLFTDSFH